MRQFLLGLFVCFTLVLPVQATERYHIELIIFRQAGVEPVTSSRVAPDNWMQNAPQLAPEQFRSSLMSLHTERLIPENGYRILLHRAWQQDASLESSQTALTSGEEIFGHHPIEGVIRLRHDRANEVELDFWINQFQADGNLAKSEQLRQSAVIPYREPGFIDHGSLGALIRILPE